MKLTKEERMKLFGNNIKKFRLEMKKSQQEVADAIGMSAATLSRYENGIIDPGLKTAKKLSDYFGISLEDMITSKKNKGITAESASKIFGMNKDYISVILEANERKVDPNELLSIIRMLKK